MKIVHLLFSGYWCCSVCKCWSSALHHWLSHISVFVTEALCVQESCWCLFQTTGDATVHRCRELPGEAGQLHHTLWNLHLCWQRRQLCVRLEHGHRLVVRSQQRAHTLLCINWNSCLWVCVCVCVGLFWLPCSAGIGRTSFVFVV